MYQLTHQLIYLLVIKLPTCSTMSMVAVLSYNKDYQNGYSGTITEQVMFDVNCYGGRAEC